MGCCHDATANSEVFAHFHTFAVKHHSSMQNWLYGLPGNDEYALECALRLSRSQLVWAFHVRLILSSPKACLIIVRVSVALFPRFAQHLMLFLCRSHREIATGQMYNSK
jgi:hypothetical protein